MSVDLGQPKITQACQELVDAGARTTWFYLHYHPSQDRSLVLSDRGTDPLVQGWQNCIRASSDQVGFGYGLLGKNRPLKEGGERGVVLLYLPSNVTGVRRARSVVHSRAVANLFPNYSAIITISSPDEITESFLQEHTNFHNHAVPTPTSSPIKSRVRPSGGGPHTGADIGLGQPLGSHTRDNPQDPSVSTASSVTSSRDKTLPPPPIEPLDIPQPVSTPPPGGTRIASNSHSGSGGVQTGSPSGTQTSTQRDSPRSSYGMDGAGSRVQGLGISSADVFGRQERKESLGSKLARAIPIQMGANYGSGASSPKNRAGGEGRTGEGIEYQAQAPHSPAGIEGPASRSASGHKKRFSIDSLTKGFGHGTASPSTPSSPSFANTQSRPPRMGGTHARVPSINTLDIPPEEAELMRNVSATSRQLAAGKMGANAELTPNGSPDAGTSSGRRRVPSLARLFPAPGARRTSGSQPSGVSFPSSSAMTEVDTRDRHADVNGPPLPPKDTHPTGAYGIGHDAPLSNGDGPGPAEPNTTRDAYNTSNDGAAALHAASDSQIRSERQQHEQYRRGEEEKARIRQHSGNRSARVVGTPIAEVSGHSFARGFAGAARDARAGAGESVGGNMQRHERDQQAPHAETDEEDEGLPYDREDHEPPVSARSSGHRGTPPMEGTANTSQAEQGGVGVEYADMAPAAAAAHASPLGAVIGNYEPSDAGPAGNDLASKDNLTRTADIARSSDATQSHGAESAHEPENESVTAAILDDDLTSGTPEPYHIEIDTKDPEHPHDGTITPHADADHTHLPAQSADAVRTTTQETVLRQAEHEASLARAAIEAAEAQRLAEETRVRIAEAEAAALEKERIEREEREEAEREAAKEARRREVEYETEQRIKREQEEREQEEKRRREEEDARHAAELAFEDNLRGMKGQGEMLRGFVTVQTPSSIIWRRRWYALYSHELRLYKAEGDEKPMTTIPLLSSRVSEKYDESQVHDSFKITTTTNEDYFLFTDSAEDKAALLRALRVALE